MVRRFFGFVSVIVIAGWASLTWAVDPYAPQPMVPNPIENTRDAGRIGAMQPFPSEPHAGYPGADANTDRRLFGYPQLLPYPGSVEHWLVWNPHYIMPIPPYNYRTLLRNFPAQEMDGVTDAMREQWAEPVEYVIRGSESIYPGAKRPPVPVVRLKPGGNRLRFALEPLPTGMYAVRLIAAIESQHREAWGKSPNDVIVTMTINDGPAGEVRHYALRQRGTDNFYSLGEFFFHVEDARPWEVTLGLHADSNIDLLVHNVDVHDMLAETAKRAGKKRAIHVSRETLEANWAREEAVAARAQHEARLATTNPPSSLIQLRTQQPELSEEELRRQWRSQRDDALWHSMPPKNFNFLSFGATRINSEGDAPTQAKLQEDTYLRPEHDWQNGGWFPALNPPNPNDRVPYWSLDYDGPWRMVQRRGEGAPLEYTAADLLAHKPLPGLPVEVKPWGKSFEGPDGKRPLLFPITQAYNSMLRHVRERVDGGTKSWVEHGVRDSAHDAAIYLARLAYDQPAHNEAHALNVHFAPRGAHFNRQTLAHQSRVSNQHVNWEELAQRYDQLFPYIQGNQALADSIGRHIKWVKTPADVIALFDTYLLQYGARETLYFRFYYDHQHSRMLANFAAMQTDPQIAEPWVQAMFERTWEYPFSYGSVEDFMYLATQRDGTQSIGSFFYANGGSAAGAAAPLLDEYIADGGDSKYQLSNLQLYPRIGQFPFWILESMVGGLHPPQIGDVGGPTTSYAHWFSDGGPPMNLGWRWSKDPRFAWVVANLGKRRTETDEQWAELLQAAATIHRNPFLSNRTRVLTDWGVILEGNPEADDYRFRQAARLRIGVGEGHSHRDSLDLGIWSMGLTMSGDMGARGGYGRPGVDNSYIHNLVTIDKGSWMGHAWARELADLDRVQYTHVDTLRSEHYSRQVAVIELDRGRASAQPPSDARHDRNTRYGSDITLPTAYFVDFARTTGGAEHSYNFHGPTEDQLLTNVERGEINDADRSFLKDYVIEGEQWAADIDQDVLQATWRMAREPITFDIPGRGQRTTRAPEPAIAGVNYDPNSPRKFLRVHLPGQRAQRLRSGVPVSGASDAGRTDGDWLRQLHVIRTGAPGKTSSLFAAVWEPYAGEPFITEVRLEGDVADAGSFAAVHVQTRAGHRDLVFSDAVAPQPRTLAGGEQIDGSFAYVSHDGAGLRQVCLVGGRELRLPEIRIKPARRAHEAQVLKLDYLNNTATLDRALPAVLAGRFFEVGTEAKDGRGARWSNFQIAASGSGRAADTGMVEWRKGADGGTGLIDSIRPLSDVMQDANQARHWTTRGATKDDVLLQLRMETGMPEGRDRQVALGKSAQGQMISADVHGQTIIVNAADATRLGLAPGDRVRLYEIAVGDTFRTATQVAMAREDGGVYRLATDTPCTVSVRARAAWSSTDGGQTWQELPAAADDSADHRQWSISAEQVTVGALRLRWE